MFICGLFGSTGTALYTGAVSPLFLLREEEIQTVYKDTQGGRHQSRLQRLPVGMQKMLHQV